MTGVHVRIDAHPELGPSQDWPGTSSLVRAGPVLGPGFACPHRAEGGRTYPRGGCGWVSGSVPGSAGRTPTLGSGVLVEEDPSIDVCRQVALQWCVGTLHAARPEILLLILCNVKRCGKGLRQSFHVIKISKVSVDHHY